MKALAIAVVLAATTTAHAEGYLGAGLSAGTDASMNHDAAVVEGGTPVHGMWSLHGMVALGNAGNATAIAPGSYLAFRLGVEARPCFTRTACVIAGIDVGHIDEAYVTTMGTGWADTFTGMYTWTDGPSTRGEVVVPRLGIDLGGDHLRLRPMLEATVGNNRDLDGVAVTVAAVYRW